MIGIMIGVGMSVCPSEYPPTVRMFIWTCVGGWRHGDSMSCHAPSHGGVMAASQQVLVPTSLPLRDLHFFSESHSLWEAPSWGSPELAWLWLLRECGSSLECPCWPTGPGAAPPTRAWGELCLTYGEAHFSSWAWPQKLNFLDLTPIFSSSKLLDDQT